MLGSILYSSLSETRALLLMLFVSLSFGIVGCKADSNSFATSNSSIGSGDGSSVDATAGFRIRIKAKSGVDAFLHRFADRAAECEIPLATINTPTDIDCMLNMMEYDLWFYGFEYELSVPANVCNFVIDNPMYYFGAQVGQGPASVTLATVDGAITACTVDGVAGVISGNLCIAGEGFVRPTGEITCDYDYRRFKGADGTEGQNCCTGRGSAAVQATITLPAPGSVTNTVIETDYGGTWNNCIDSAHSYIDDWPKSSDDIAQSVIYALGTSPLFRSTKVPSTFSAFLAKKRFYSTGNFLNAGFHDWTTYAANPATWRASRRIARAFRPIQDEGPNGNYTGATTLIPSSFNGSQEFRCLNPAGEVKHRIRLYVNEWNTIEEFQEYKTNGDPAAVDPTVRGVSSVNCLAINVGSCNTIWGYDDMLNEFGGGAFAYIYPIELIRGSPP